MTPIRPLPPLRDRTLLAVLARAVAQRPDAPALRDPQRALSYAEAYEAARVLGGGLSRLGAAPGRPVLLMLDNHLDFAVGWLGLALVGAVEVPVNTAYRGSMLAYLIEDSDAEVIVIENRYCERLAQVADRLSTLRTVVVRGGSGSALSRDRFEVVRLDALLDATPATPVEAQPWDLTAIMYTSGTTGPSKGVLVSHAHAYGYCTPTLFDACGPDDRALVTLPLFHIGGQWAGVYNALIASAEAVVLDGFHATTYWDDVRRYGATYTLMLGAMAGFLYRQPQRPDDADNPMTRALMVPVIPEVESFSERFGITIGTAYGSTEGSSTLFSDFGDARAGVCGRLRDDFEARIVDENDIEVPAGEVGELVLRAREPWSVMAGYHGKPEATVEVWRNQWLHTGDAFVIDADGRYRFIDRRDDALRRRGENISSFEVESAINEHPAVQESAAVAVASEHTEDEILAVVALLPDAEVTPEQLCAFLAENLPYFMVPRYVRLVDALPKTPTEKIQKKELRAAGVTEDTWDREAAGLTVRR